MTNKIEPATDQEQSTGLEPFFGNVNLAHWIRHTDGQQYCQVAGMISVCESAELFGFRPGRTESTWMVMVSGPTQTMYIKGEEVYTITQHDAVRTLGNDCLVLA